MLTKSQLLSSYRPRCQKSIQPGTFPRGLHWFT